MRALRGLFILLPLYLHFLRLFGGVIRLSAGGGLNHAALVGGEALAAVSCI